MPTAIQTPPMASTATRLNSLKSPAQSVQRQTLRTGPLDFPLPNAWKCTETGLIVPKTIGENLRWRRAMRKKAAADHGFRTAVLQACSSSCLYWINGWAWTYRQKHVSPEGNEVPITGPQCHTPFITWPVQDDAITGLLDCIEIGEDTNMEKSRDMGVTWLALAVADWFFLFKSNVNIGTASRKEELVDKPGDMDTLFEKLRYLHRMLPPWQLPKIRDKFMFLHNLELNSTIIGESTNVDVGRGGRKTWYLVDEAAAISKAENVEASLSNNTACQVWVSTPHGPNTQFHRRIIEKRGRLIQLPWYRHPEKAAGAKQIYDEAGRVRWTSPWYRGLDKKFSRKTIAQEVDMDHGQAGDMVFDYTELQRHRQDHETGFLLRGDLITNQKVNDEQEIELLQQMNPDYLMLMPDHKRAPWRFWCELPHGRPPQYWTYVFGIDVSNGTGASNSVISVLAVETNQIVAKFWDAFTPPEQMAVLVARAGIWFGGLRPPAFIVWENNGPGGIMGRKLVGMSYPTFYRQRSESLVRSKKTPRWGWHSSKEQKIQLLGLYRDALRRDDIINPCVESLDEAADYIYDPSSGTPIPSVLREETAGGRSLHGDHVIADALCWLGKQEMPAGNNSTMRAPAGSYADRRAKGKRKKRLADPWKG